MSLYELLVYIKKLFECEFNQVIIVIANIGYYNITIIVTKYKKH